MNGQQSLLSGLTSIYGNNTNILSTQNRYEYSEEHHNLIPPEEDQYEGGNDQVPAPDVENKNQPEPSIASRPKPQPINYAFMDGLRGLGAFAVYLSHMRDQFYSDPTPEQLEAGFDRQMPTWISNTPLKIIYRGYFWVMLFFILSGFVLPMRYFKTGKTTCITGGTFRRYLRLMVPVFVIMSLYYLCSKMDFMGPYTYVRIRNKTWGEFIIDQLFTTWFGGDDWSTATWTMSIELFATFFIYLLSQTSVNYRNRFWIYVAALIFFFVPQFTDEYKWTKYKPGKIVTHFPVFFFGVLIADLETFKEYRPLDSLRDLSIWWKIPINFVLFAVAVSFGSYSNNARCGGIHDGYCDFWAIISWDGVLPMPFVVYIGANAFIILALTSSWLQWFLGSVPIQFMGRISFALYLVHELFTEWAIVDVYYYFISIDVSQNLAVLYSWLIFTPVLILLAWLLTVLVDDPAKDFAYELDIMARIDRPPAPKRSKNGEPISKEEQEVFYNVSSFFKRQWKLYLMITWIILVLSVCAIYNAFKPEAIIHPNEAHMGIIVTSQLKGR